MNTFSWLILISGIVNGLSYSIIVISVVAMIITSITLVGMASDG